MSVRLTIIYVSLFVGLVGVGMSLIASRLPLGPKKTELKNLSAILMGGAFLLYGAFTAVAIRRANRITIVGMLTDLSQSHGRHSASNFTVTRADGVPVRLRTDYSGGYLEDFQQVRVTYVQGFGTVTDLQIVPHGFELQESDGSLSSMFIGAFGVAVFFRMRR